MKRLLACIMVVLFITINPATVLTSYSQETIDNLRGKPFSDPSVISPMPEDWKKKPIQYLPDFFGADIVIDLNQQIEPYFEPLVKEFAAKNKLKIVSMKGTCGKSAARIDRKEIDVGGFCCPPGERDRLPGLKYHTMGISPLALLVHQDNPVKNVSLKDARNIFQGKISNWSEVGGPDLPIKRIVSFHCKHRPGHWKLLLSHEDLFSPDLMQTGEMEDMIVFVASNPGAIGYESPLVAERFKHRGVVKALKIDGYGPEAANLKKPEYPIYRTFTMTSWEGKDSNSHSIKLIDYLIHKVEEVGEKIYMLPVSVLKKNGWKFVGDELVGEPKSE